MNELIDLKIKNRHWRERIRKDFSLYPSFGPMVDAVDAFARRNGIFTIGWESKTYKKAGREALKVCYKIILDKLKSMGATKVRYDRKCGCACGCSPGFRIAGEGFDFNRQLRNKDGFGKIVVDQKVVDEFVSKLNTVYQEMWEEEWAENNSTQLELFSA